MRSGTIRRMPLVLVVVLAAASALLPGTGMATPPESDGSTYTWGRAAVLTADIKPWGGGYVRSDPSARSRRAPLRRNKTSVVSAIEMASRPRRTDFRA